MSRKVEPKYLQIWKNSSLKKAFTYLAILSLGIVLVYLTPLFFDIGAWHLDFVYPKVLVDDYGQSLLRTLLFAMSSTLIVIVVSFLGGHVLGRLDRKSDLLVGSLLLLPFLLGTVSTSFLFKLLIMDTGLMNFAFEHSIVIFLILGLMQFWQFGTLFMYIFWINNLGMSSQVKNYASYYKFTTWEKLKNIAIPYHRNLVILLSIFFFVSNIYENIKLQIIFRASKGTSSEMIAGTLYQSYMSDSKISSDFASGVLFSQTVLFYLPLFILCAFLIYLTASRMMGGLSKSKLMLPASFQIGNQGKQKISRIVLYLMVGMIVLPIVGAMSSEPIRFGGVDYLFQTIGLSMSASIVLLVIFSLPLAYVLRVLWRQFFAEINDKSLWVFLSLFLLFLVPPLTLMLFGFEWSSIFQTHSRLSTRLMWILGQCINTLPIIASFLFVIHFTVSNRELDYLSIMRVNFDELVRWSFLRRFRVEYLMTLLFAFSIIWNEGTFNKVYSDRIPSYVSEILRTVNSRNADYGQGMLYFLFSMGLGLLCIGLWNYIVSRFIKIAR